MAAMATVEPSNRPDARPLLAQGGRRFFHKEHGMCELLPKGQWMMQPTKADGEDDKSKRQFPVVYFRVCRRHVPEDVLADAEKWDPDMYDGLKCEPSASIRAMIKNPVMDVALELSLEFEHTVELRFAGYKKHPMFGEVDGYKKLDFAKQLRTTRSDVYIKAKDAARALAVDMKDKPDAAASIMRSLVYKLALAADDMHKALKPSRPAHLVDGEARSELTTADVPIDENEALYLSSLLALCGFAAESDGCTWRPAVSGAVQQLVSLHAHPTGINPLRRMWEFTDIDMKTWLGDGGGDGDGDGASETFFFPTRSTDKMIYDRAQSELGDLAFDAARRMKPAWLLRGELEQKMIKEGDVRLKAHAEILPETFELILMDRKIQAAGMAGKKLVLGSVFAIHFEWNGWVRKNSPGDKLEPLFKQHAAAAMKCAASSSA